MALDFLQELLPNLNSARLASLGETIFRETMVAAGSEVRPADAKQTNLLVDGQRVDVKTSAQALGSQPVPVVPYQGKRVKGVSYALVEFFDSGARVSREEETVALLSWDRVGELWQRWNQDRVEAAEGAGTPEEKKKLLAPIRKEIADLLRGHGYPSRIIYRTNQAEFGDESPANLKVAHPTDGRVVVYLDFRDHEIRRDNLRAVYAFLESGQDELPVLQKTRLKVPKVDLSQMGQLKFRDLEDLEENWRRVLPANRD
jgi:hypothetical protein